MQRGPDGLQERLLLFNLAQPDVGIVRQADALAELNTDLAMWSQSRIAHTVYSTDGFSNIWQLSVRSGLWLPLSLEI